MQTTGDNGDVVIPMTNSSNGGEANGDQRLVYSWENLSVYASVPNGSCFTRMCKKSPPVQRKILDNSKLNMTNDLFIDLPLSRSVLLVTGAVKQGEFLAIMGASGAGKTTFLNCLTFRNTGKLHISGDRYLNGQVVNPDSLARISSYNQQEDLFIGALTVREMLRFQAVLRMDKHLTHTERMNRVEEVLVELGLAKCADTIIGEPERGIKGISGGEKKRLAFATEVFAFLPL